MASPHHLLNTGSKIPSLGFGTLLLKGREAYSCVSAAIREGYRHIDTARYYENEKEIGKAIQDSKIKRDEFFVTSKLRPMDQGLQLAKQAALSSLKELNMDYIDLYLIHWPGCTGVPASQFPKFRAESWQALEKLQKEGKCKAIGVSNYTVRHLKELLANCTIKPAVNQVEFSPRLYQKELLDFCTSQGIVVEAYSPLQKGGNILTEDVVMQIAAKYNRTCAQVLLRWAIQHNMVVLPRSSNDGRIRENSKIFDFELQPEDMAALDAMNQNERVCWDPTNIT
eukprot:Phypoly_transcript_10162.p1 GENE.Phypoly_transcript_10162~~Phypoly_transcript_10162.p1  ORF type:complete len:282 (+),score=38.70 Phypoly_transcript_10162:72-917(+)